MNAAIAATRLRNQHITDPVGGPAALVARLGAVQAQEFEAAKWALGLRLRGAATDTTVEDGRILRTHVLRPTWHFVPRADIRWMLELTGPRVQRTVSSYHRRLGLEPRLLARAGIVLDSMPLAFTMTDAELKAVVCRGPRRDRQFTYALIADRAPDARTLSRDQALATLVRRYFGSHGPATVRDFVWWSGLTTADAKRGLEIVRARQAAIDGLTYWTAGPDARAALPRRGVAHLLPIYDEYLVAYRDRRSNTSDSSGMVSGSES
jgi:hypothetical protein